MSSFLPTIGNIIKPYIQNPVKTAEDLLPPIGATLGGIGGGIAGAAVPVADLSGVPEVAGAVAGSGAGYNIGQGAEDFLQGKKYNPTSPENLIGTGIAMGTEGIGQGVAAGIGKAAEGIAAKNAAKPLTQFKTTPSDIVNFPTKHGSGIGLLDYINKFKGTSGGTWDGTAENFKTGVLDPLNEQYGDLLGQGNVKVNKQDILDKYNQKIGYEKMMNPKNPNNNFINALESERDNNVDFLDKLHNNNPNYDARIVNARKTYVDSQTPDAKFQLTPNQTTNINRVSGDILRNSVYEAADQANDPAMAGMLKQTGKDLKAAHALNDMAEDTKQLTQAGKFTPGQPSSGILTKGSFAAGLMESGIIGLLAHHLGMPYELAAPLGMAGAGALTAGGQKIVNPLISGANAVIDNPIGKNLVRGTAQLIGNNITKNGVQNQALGSQNDQFDNHADNNSTYPLVMQVPNEVAKNYDPKSASWQAPDFRKSSLPSDMPNVTYTKGRINKALANPDNVGWQDYIGNIGKQNDTNVSEYLSSKGFGPDEQKFMQQYSIDNNNMNSLSKVISKYGTGWINNAPLAQKIQGYNDPDFGVALSMMQNLNLQNIRSIQGRAPSVYEQQGGGNMFPVPTDSTKTAIAKLNQIQSERQQNYAKYAPYAKFYNQYLTQDAIGDNGNSLPPVQ